jgi:Tfp pilus assembly protein PilX
MNSQRQRSYSLAPQRERGTVLIIALIVLVAMTLAGIATMRSVDTATVMAGNIAFRQSAANAADLGIQAGYVWLASNLTTAVLSDDNNNPSPTSVGYFSSAATDETKWSDPNVWDNAAKLNGGAADAAGNKVWYRIERMCPVANCAANAICPGGSNLCGSTPDSGALSREGQDHFRQTSMGAFTKPPAIHYRVTAKAEGPRKSVTIVQTMLRAI